MNIIATNKKAYFDYEIVEKFEAGIALCGSEIKSIRQKNVNLKGSYITLRDGEAWIRGMHISEFKYANIKSDPIRERKLLLKKGEIERMTRKLLERGNTCVPLSIGISPRGLAKLQIALVKGKKQYDKRASLKKKDEERQMAVKMKSHK